LNNQGELRAKGQEVSFLPRKSLGGSRLGVLGFNDKPGEANFAKNLNKRKK